MRLLVLLLLLLPAYGFAAPVFVPNADALATQGTVERLADGAVLLTPTTSAVNVHGKERFERAILLYVPRGDDQDGPSGLLRNVTLHYNETDGENARRTAKLLARLVGLHQSRLRRSPVYGRNRSEAHVYLTPNRSPTMEESGGETRDNNLTIYGTGTPRTILEWTRTTAHEWGHLTLWAARGYSAPENDAAGYLGERLYMRWLRETQTAESGDDGVTRADLDIYETRQIAPLVTRFLALKQGPRDPALYTMDARAMDLYIGAVLCADAAWGSATVADALYSLPDTTPRAFFAALRAILTRKPAAPRAPCWAWKKNGWVRVTPAKSGMTQ